LHEYDEADADIGVNDAQGRTEGIEGLSNDDSPLTRGAHCGGRVLLHQLGVPAVRLSSIERNTQEEDVQPVGKQCDAIGNESCQERRGKRHERDQKEEREVNPGQIAVAPGEAVQLGLLAHPEDAESQETHEVGDQTGGKMLKSTPQVRLVVDGVACRHVQVEHEKQHGDGEYTVTQGAETIQALSGEAVVPRAQGLPPFTIARGSASG
jgi:hypothetical protein